MQKLNDYPLPDNYRPKIEVCMHPRAQKSMYMGGEWWYLCYCGAVLYGYNRQFAFLFRNLSQGLDTVPKQT